MKLLFASDIHGSAFYCRKLMERYEDERPEKVILLGDILYHGPRNPLPEGYMPSEVAAMLNSIKSEILCVRGNCDSEVDQMVLDFPITADYCDLLLDGREFFLTHGHIYSPENMPKLKEGSAFVFGHIHLPVAEKKDGIVILNPGSAALPKGGNPNSYAEYEDGLFAIKTFDGETIKSIEL